MSEAAGQAGVRLSAELVRDWESRWWGIVLKGGGGRRVLVNRTFI